MSSDDVVDTSDQLLAMLKAEDDFENSPSSWLGMQGLWKLRAILEECYLEWLFRSDLPEDDIRIRRSVSRLDLYWQRFECGLVLNEKLLPMNDVLNSCGFSKVEKRDALLCVFYTMRVWKERGLRRQSDVRALPGIWIGLPVLCVSTTIGFLDVVYVVNASNPSLLVTMAGLVTSLVVGLWSISQIYIEYIRPTRIRQRVIQKLRERLKSHKQQSVCGYS